MMPYAIIVKWKANQNNRNQYEAQSWLIMLFRITYPYYPRPCNRHAAPAKKWADTEGFGDLVGLSEMFHVVDHAVAAEVKMPLIPYYQTTKTYGGLQCDGLHFGKANGGLYGCTGFPVVTDVVLQTMLNKVCRNVTPTVGCSEGVARPPR